MSVLGSRELPVSPEGDTFLSEAEVGNRYLAEWRKQSTLFAGQYDLVFRENDFSTICQYGIGPSGELIDLRDGKEWLERAWLGVVTLGFWRGLPDKSGIWRFTTAEASYRGRTVYEIAHVSGQDLSKAEYDTQGSRASYSSITSQQETANIIDWMTDVLMHPATLQRARQLLALRSELLERREELTAIPDTNRNVVKELKKVNKTLTIAYL